MSRSQNCLIFVMEMPITGIYYIEMRPQISQLTVNVFWFRQDGINSRALWPYECLISWWRHQMENIFCITGHLCWEFPGPWWIPGTKASDSELWYFIDLRRNKLLSKQSWGWWFETPSRPLWRHRNVKPITDRTTTLWTTWCIKLFRVPWV